MYINNFRRFEEKFILTKDQRDILLDRISDHIKKDQYYESTICNIYFDDDNKDLIINSLEKPTFKEKVRVRSYNVPTLNDNVYLEAKTKYKGIVGKRRIKIKLKDLYKYLDDHNYNKNSQIMKEIDYYFKYYDLKPSIYIAYDRISFQGVDDPNFRITFDSNLRSRYDDLHLESGDHGEKFFPDDLTIMEIKTLTSCPLWLTDVLSELKVYSTSFSKYGEIYKKNFKEEFELC